MDEAEPEIAGSDETESEFEAEEAGSEENEPEVNVEAENGSEEPLETALETPESEEVIALDVSNLLEASTENEAAELEAETP